MQPPQAPAYAASPLGSYPELAQLYATGFAAPLSNAKTSVQANQDQVSVENAKRAQAEADARAKAFSDAKNYTVVQRDDGGFGFYGPDGKEVSAAQYANNTGQKLTSVLKDSQNPIDIRYVQDQQNLTKYLQAKAQSNFDPTQKKIAQTIENQVYKAHGIDLGQANPAQIIKAMQYNYPTIYGAHQDNSPGFSGANQFLPSPDNLYSQAGGEAKFNRGLTSGGNPFGGANPTGQ